MARRLPGIVEELKTTLPMGIGVPMEQEFVTPGQPVSTTEAIRLAQAGPALSGIPAGGAPPRVPAAAPPRVPGMPATDPEALGEFRSKQIAMGGLGSREARERRFAQAEAERLAPAQRAQAEADRVRRAQEAEEQRKARAEETLQHELIRIGATQAGPERVAQIKADAERDVQLFKGMTATALAAGRIKADQDLERMKGEFPGTKEFAASVRAEKEKAKQAGDISRALIFAEAEAKAYAESAPVTEKVTEPEKGVKQTVYTTGEPTRALPSSEIPAVEGSPETVPADVKDLDNDGIISERERQIADLNNAIVTRKTRDGRDVGDKAVERMQKRLKELRAVKVETKG